METPSAGPGAPSESTSSPESAPERGDHDVVLFLGSALLPALGDRVPRALREALRRCVRENRLTPLETLSGRQRHDLLLVLEQVSGTRRRPSPSVVVRLTTVIGATPAAPESVGVASARPAR